MNKTMSKARELLINSRLTKKNETHEQKIENQLNPCGEVRSLNHDKTELGDSKSENKSSGNNIDNCNNSNLDNIVSSGNLVTHSQENINITKNNDEYEFKKTTEKDTDHQNINLNSANAKNEEMNSVKSVLSDRLALFENKKISKESEKQSNSISANKDRPEKIDVRSEQNKLNANKPNLLDRFNKNVNKGPVIFKQLTIPIKEEIVEREESDKPLPEIEVKQTSVEQDKLMKRMISAKNTKAPIKGKDLGKSKASEKIMGLASMLQNKLGSKEANESPQQKTFLLTNDADIQIFNDDNKAILSKSANEEPNSHIEQQESKVILERKSLIEMMLEKPMYNTKTAKKRTQKAFHLKDEI